MSVIESNSIVDNAERMLIIPYGIHYIFFIIYVQTYWPTNNLNSLWFSADGNEQIMENRAMSLLRYRKHWLTKMNLCLHDGVACKEFTGKLRLRLKHM